MALHNIQGIRAEHLAQDYFLNSGYAIFHRNCRHSRYEIDIIATKNETLHFIEVKPLSTSGQVYPEVHITPKKSRGSYLS